MPKGVWDLYKRFSDERDWDDQTFLTLAMAFIDSQGEQVVGEFERYLESQPTDADAVGCDEHQ